jgi:hypothetical protein
MMIASSECHFSTCKSYSDKREEMKRIQVTDNPLSLLRRVVVIILQRLQPCSDG